MPSIDSNVDEQRLLKTFLVDRIMIKNAMTRSIKPYMMTCRESKVICNLLFSMESAKTGLINKSILVERLTNEGLMDEAIKEYLAKISALEPLSMAEMMARIEILKMQVGHTKLKALNCEIDDYLHRRGEQKDRDLIDFISETIHNLSEIQQLRFKKRILPLKYTVSDLEKQIRDQKGGDIQGYDIRPFKALGRNLGGLKKGLFYGLAGAPRRGKTTLSLHIAMYVARNHKVPVLYYSWEQTSKVLTMRLIGAEGLINPNVLLGKDVKKSDVQRFYNGARRLKEALNRLYIVEAGRGDNFDRIEAHAYNLMQEFNTDKLAIFIDYLQKMPVDNAHSDAQVRINTISSGLANLSMSLNCPVFAISSLDKEGCKLDERDSDGGGPTMHNCTGSGDIEYDLDVAMLLTKDWRDSTELDQQIRKFAQLYKIPIEQIPKVDILNLTVEKNRDAPPGVSLVVQYLFLIENNKMIELGFKSEDEENTYNKISRLVKQMISEKIIWPDMNFSQSKPSPEDSVSDG